MIDFVGIIGYNCFTKTNILCVWRVIEVVITNCTRNAVVLFRGTWVRIPHSPLSVYLDLEPHNRLISAERTEPIRARLGKKEQRKAELEKKIQEVEAFIARLPEGMDKQIFEMVYLDGMTQRKVGEVLGYSEGRISQIISKYLKD